MFIRDFEGVKSVFNSSQPRNHSNPFSSLPRFDSDVRTVENLPSKSLPNFPSISSVFVSSISVQSKYLTNLFDPSY